MIWVKIIRPILFRLDAEFVHDLALFYIGIYNKNKFLNQALFKALNYTSPRLKQKHFGLYFRTPIGLAAGMDKNASGANAWSSFDFGWCQLGSITAKEQLGNPRPRLWRLPKDKAILVNYGLSNLGADKIYKKLSQLKKIRGLWSISIAKSNDVPLEQAAEDYAQSFMKLKSLADIITINLSCPNVKNFTGLQNKELLEPILAKITALNKQQKPLWLKIGHELNKQQLDDIIYLVKKYQIQAIIAANLAKDKSQLNLQSKYKNKPGSVSGKPISYHVNQTIAYLYKNSEEKFIIVGTGGIFDGEDAFTKIKAGASLLQTATGYIYGGPQSIKKINKELDKLLIKGKFSHISQAVGTEANKYSL